MKKLARKVVRATKVASQFKFTCTFEYIDLVCLDGWKPENLQVVWLRGHRRIDSPTVKWTPKSESGNSVEGRATFDPPISASLLITLYQAKEQQDYEQKEYKFYIENEGVNGKKILASFNCNIADFAGVPSERHALDMTFKPVSKKISKALLGLTMESEFLKKGKSTDDDMMSTFSRVSGNQEGDDDDDDPTVSTSSFQNLPVDTSISQPSDSLVSTVTNGTADESITSATSAAISDAPKGILKTSSKISSGNGPIEAAAVIPGQVTVEGEKKNFETEDNAAMATKDPVNDETVMADITDATTNSSAVVQIDNEHQIAHSYVTANGTTSADITTDKVEETVSNSNDISILPVTVEPIPPVTVEPIPPVTVEPIPPVTVEPIPPVTVEPIPPVTVESVPPVTVEPIPPVTVEPIPPVTVEPIPPVTVEPIPPVTVEPIPPVTVEPVPPVTVEPIPPVTVEPIPPVTVEPIPPVTVEPIPPVTVEPISPVTVKPIPPVTVEPIPPVTVEPIPPATVEPIPPVTIEPIPPVTVEAIPPVTVEAIPPVTVEQEFQSKVGAADHTNTVSSANQDITPVKSKKNKFGKSKNPPKGDAPSQEPSKFVAPPTMEGPCWLPDDIALIDADNQPVPKITLDQVELIGLYFSAGWCGPCKKFMPKLLKFYNYLKEEERSFQIIYVPSDNTKDGMLAYMKEQNMPWLGLAFDSPLGEQLRGDYKVSAIPLLCIVSHDGEVISDSAKKPIDSASSSEEEMTRLYNKWMRKLLDIKGLPVPEEVEPEKKKGLLSSLFGGKKKDKHQHQPPQTDTPTATKNEDDVDEAPPTSSKQGGKDKMTEELLRQKEQLERERTLERQVVQEKTQKLHVTLELNAQMQKDLSDKEEKIRILEAKNETLRQTADTKTDEIETLKQKISMLEQELSAKADEEKKLLDEKRELLANISLHGWLCKKGVKGPTANTWRRRYFKIEEGSKLTYYKTAGDGPPQGYIDIDRIVSVKALPGSQQDKNNCTFHVATENRVYELLAHDEATMNKWINSLQYMKEWRAKQKREANH